MAEQEERIKYVPQTSAIATKNGKCTEKVNHIMNMPMKPIVLILEKDEEKEKKQRIIVTNSGKCQKTKKMTRQDISELE